MTADPSGPGHGGRDDADLGEPIAELRDVSWPVDARFPARVRTRIERRVVAGTFLELLWTAPMAMLIEFLRWPFDGLAERRERGPTDPPGPGRAVS